MEKEKQPQYEIRSATMSDAVPVRMMHAESWLATYPNEENGVSYEWVKKRTDEWLTPESIEETKEYFANVIADASQFYRVAESDGEIAGFLHLTDRGDEVELEAIYTRPDTFGTGLGRQLMNEALKYIGNRDSGLTVVSYNQRAIHFYEKYGFEKVEGSDNIYADKMPIVRMIRNGEKHEI